MDRDDIRQVRNFYCVDCDKYTDQKYITELADNTLVYVCQRCACENIIEEE